MVWFKVDDKLHDHRKARQARKAAMGVWVLAGSWSADNLTDGFVPEDVASRWGTRHDFVALVSAGLWVEATAASERGWRFVNWDEFQPTKAEVEHDRAKKAEAGRKGGKASGRSRREASAQAGASMVVEPPNPTRPEPPTSNEVGSSPRKRATQLPADWQPSPAHTDLAAERGVNLSEEAAKFRDWCASKGEPRKDWEATFRNWIRNSRPTLPPGGTRPTGWGAPTAPPAPPRELVDDPRGYEAWLADWSAGKPVRDCDGNLVQREAS